MNYLYLPQILFCEHLNPKPFNRCPEQDLVMTGVDQVNAFDSIGQAGGILEGIYLWNVLGLSRRIPQGGTLLDLGCGPGTFIWHLLQYRPDVKVIGIDLSPEMLKKAQKRFENHPQVHFITGDVKDFQTLLDRPIDTISSIFAAHHMADGQALKHLLGQIIDHTQKTGAKIWIFDHVRPNHIKIPKLFPKAFMKGQPNAVCQDSQNSLMASFSFREICDILSVLPELVHRQSSIIPYYQAHASPPLQSGDTPVPSNRALKEFQTIMGRPL